METKYQFFPFISIFYYLCSQSCYFGYFFLFQGTLEYLTGAAISKLIAAVATYPYQVVRARLQDQQSNYSGALNCVRQTFRYEGMSGLYKGLVPYLVHVMPNICIVFLIYENMSKWHANVSFHTVYCQQRILLDWLFFDLVFLFGNCWAILLF